MKKPKINTVLGRRHLILTRTCQTGHIQQVQSDSEEQKLGPVTQLFLARRRATRPGSLVPPSPSSCVDPPVVAILAVQFTEVGNCAVVVLQQSGLTAGGLLVWPGTARSGGRGRGSKHKDRGIFTVGSKARLCKI